MERLSGLPGALRQTLNDRLWQSIAEDNYESIYAAVATANQPLQIVSKTSLIFRVEAIVASVPASQTALIQLGDVYIPVGAGQFQAQGLSLQLAQNDIKAITPTGAGPTSLLLTGKQLPPYSVMTR